MEPRKQKEIEHYDQRVKRQIEGSSVQLVDFEGFNPFFLESYKFLQRSLKDKCQNKKVLDYGCGNGIHSVWLAGYGANVLGIDLSEHSLQVAEKRVGDKAEFALMDCESMSFPDKSFDIVFDGGTFSSLDLDRGFSELARVLKPDGFLIGIETLGHNPFTNLKRKINKLAGKRTEWAAGHIFKMRDLRKAEKYFGKIETYFFHLFSWITFPFLKLPGGKSLLRIFEKIEYFLISIFPFLKRYSFKIVFVFSQPRHRNVLIKK